jgi:transcriptional regulator with XRE-family HTH domain
MTSNEQLLQIKSKKIGLMLIDARTSLKKSVKECASAMGVTSHRFKLYETGQLAPSLPELEAFSYFLEKPLTQFLGDQFEQDIKAKDEAPTTVGQYIMLRQRVIGANLRLARTEANFSLKNLADKTSISVSKIGRYEKGESSIPLPELEIISQTIKLPLESLFVQSGKVGNWRKKLEMIDEFMKLPSELQQFVSKPVNRPYIDLAIRLSSLSADKLRAVAEGLLEITY